MCEKMATEKQVQYCRDLFRKTKFHYQCLGDAELRDSVLERTGYDLDDLTHADAHNIIRHLKRRLTGRKF